MLPARERGGDLLDRNVGRYLGDDGIDLIVGLQRAAARGLAPRGRRRQLELQSLRVAQGNVADGIAGRGHLFAHQADDGELVAVRAERHLLAELETGGAVDDHLIMVAQDFAPRHQLAGAAGPARLEADQEQPQRLAVELGLHRLIGDGAGAFHAIDAADQFARVAGNARGFRERAVGAGLHHPEIGIGRARLPQRVVDQPAIDAGDHDHDAEQQAQAEIGQHEAQQIVLDVPVGEIHRFGSLAMVAARPTRKPLRNCVTTSAFAGTPPVIS